MILTFGTRFCPYPNNVIATSTKISPKRISLKHLKLVFSHGNGGHLGLSFIRTKELLGIDVCKRMDWSIKSNADGRGLDPLADSGDGRTRLLKTIPKSSLKMIHSFWKISIYVVTICEECTVDPDSIMECLLCSQELVKY